MYRPFLIWTGRRGSFGAYSKYSIKFSSTALPSPGETASIKIFLNSALPVFCKHDYSGTTCSIAFPALYFFRVFSDCSWCLQLITSRSPSAFFFSYLEMARDSGWVFPIVVIAFVACRNWQPPEQGMDKRSECLKQIRKKKKKRKGKIIN